MSKTFNIYCDESTHLLKDGMPFMLVSYVSCAYPQIKIHKQFVRLLKEKYKFKGEIKWANVSKRMSQFYGELIDYFFATDLTFRSVIVKKEQIDETRASFTYNDFYFEMYKELISHKLCPEYTYNIYLDIKDTRSQKKIKILKEVLNGDENIREIQFVRSHESYLMQMADVIMGALNYHLRGENKVIAKNKLIEKIEYHSKIDLATSTPKEADKFNLYHIDLK
ncbi:DUF3800 domain-containing protein [Arcticibacter tournemirensis]